MRKKLGFMVPLYKYYDGQLCVRLYFVAGTDIIIELTTKADLEMVKAYLKTDKDNWLK